MKEHTSQHFIIWHGVGHILLVLQSQLPILSDLPWLFPTLPIFSRFCGPCNLQTCLCTVSMDFHYSFQLFEFFQILSDSKSLT
jgi:hypothetical protein